MYNQLINSRNEPLIKGLGRYQRQLLKRMKDEKLVIRLVHDVYENTSEITLQDETSDNIYESISLQTVLSLAKRRLVKRFDFLPCLQVSITTWRLIEGIDI